MLRDAGARPRGRLTRAGTIEHSPDIASGGLQAAALAYRAELIRFLGARGVSADEAEDILQDLYVKVCTLRIAPVAEPRAYLYRMTANLLFDRRRAAARRSAREGLWADAGPGLKEQIDEQPTAEQELGAREDLAIVSQALASLPERTVEILRRYRLDGETQKAIASQLGISLSAVEKHLQKAYRAVIEAQARLDADQARPSGSEAQG
ncbi:MAG TPA: sigma-70 family RNA polymerase sigma factor [Croceibacterium sp.]